MARNGTEQVRHLQADTSKNKSDTYRSIAEAFRIIHEWAKAAYWYNKLITEYPDSPPVDYYWASVMYYYVKDYANAGTAAEKFETKYPDQPSSTYWRARVAAAIDSEAKEGTAVPFFTKWVDKVGANSDKKSDLKATVETSFVRFDFRVFMQSPNCVPSLTCSDRPRFVAAS